MNPDSARGRERAMTPSPSGTFSRPQGARRPGHAPRMGSHPCATTSTLRAAYCNIGGDRFLRLNEPVGFFGAGALGPTHDLVVGGVRLQVSVEFQPYATAELQTDGSLLVSRIGASGQDFAQRFFEGRHQGRPWRLISGARTVSSSTMSQHSPFASSPYPSPARRSWFMSLGLAAMGVRRRIRALAGE